MKAQYLIELLGTFFLVLTIGLSQNPIAIGFVLMVLVYTGATISGAHYNPAVTIALFLRKKIDKDEMIAYIISQLIGASLAAFVVINVFSQKFTVVPGSTVSWLSALVAETLYTALLVTVILHVAASKKTSGNQYFGLAIGGAVLAGALSVGSISGGAFNPAVGLGPFIINFLSGTTSLDMSLFFLYSIGPILGGIIASYLHGYTQE